MKGLVAAARKRRLDIFSLSGSAGESVSSESTVFEEKTVTVKKRRRAYVVSSDSEPEVEASTPVPLPLPAPQLRDVVKKKKPRPRPPVTVVGSQEPTKEKAATVPLRGLRLLDALPWEL